MGRPKKPGAGPDGKHPCQICGKLFGQYNELSSHMRIHTGEKPFKCLHPDCGQFFRTCGDRIAHMRIHTGEKPFVCTICSTPFATNANLCRHQLTHKDPASRTRIPCKFCQLSFMSAIGLAQHINRIHGPNEKPFECTYCRKKFATGGPLSRHVKIHTGEKPHCCHQCKGSFSSTKALLSHLAHIHSNARPHGCPVCGKGFKSSGSLTNHMDTHRSAEERRRFKCGICEKEFNYKWHVDRHVAAVHANQRPHECLLCAKKFKESYHLNEHLRRHTGEL